MSQLQGITGNVGAGVGPTGIEKAGSSGAPEKATPRGDLRAETATDKAQLSPLGSTLALQDPDGDVRTDKVAALQAAIRAGSYNPPASATADKLISSLLR